MRSGKNGQSSVKLPPWAKAAAGAAAALLVVGVFQWGLPIPNPGVFYVLAVAVCGFLGGAPSAFAAVPILCAGIALVYSTPGHPFSYAGDNRLRMVMVLISVPATALLVSVLKARADRNLAASEARFETLVNALPFGLVVSRGEQIIVANPAAVELFRAGTAAALTGGSMWATVHPDYREIVRQRMAMLDQGGNGNGDRGRRLEAIEEKFLRLDGTVLDAEVSGARVELDGGHGRLVVIRDIAARKRMEARIREQVRDLSLLHEVSRALLFGLAPADIPEYLCGLVVERLGAQVACVGIVADAADVAVTTDVVVGAEACCPGGCDDGRHGSARRDGPDALAVANAKPILMRELQTDPRAAAWREWATARGHRAAACIPLIGPDRVLAVLSVFFDDTAALDEPRFDLLQSLGNLAAIALSEAHTKEQIRRSQARLELAMEAGRMGAFEWDLRTGRIVWEANHAALFGVTPAEFDGTYESFARLIHPDDLPVVERGVALARESRGLFEQEYRAVWPDGSVHWIAGRGRFVYDDAGGGRPVRMSGVVLDIDRRRHAEAIALEQQAQLAHVQRLTLVSQLASGLAHEVNQPLTAVSNFAGAALQLHRDARLTPDAARDLFAEVHAQAQRAGEIVRRMRGFMQKRGPELAPADLNALVAEALALMGPELSRGRVRATFEPAVDLAPVRIDPVQVQQVLVNLIQNGIDAMADAPDEQRTLSVSVSRCDGRATVRVTDAGHGIAPGDLAHVFDSFFSTKPGGLGMGLNISRSIVESHGGSLTAANNPPDAAPGATFEFALPIGG